MCKQGCYVSIQGQILDYRETAINLQVRNFFDLLKKHRTFEEDPV